MTRIRDGQSLGLDRDGLIAPILLTFDDLAIGILDDQFLANTRHGGKQTLGVVVLRRVEDLLDAALFDDVAAVHDHDLIGDVGDHAHVVGDDEHGCVELVAGETQQVEDFGLHGHVEGGGRLVGQNQAGVEHQGHGDDDALLLAAGELVWVVVDAGFRVRNADLLENVDGLGTEFLLVLHAMGAKAFLDLPSDGVHRVEHRIGLLEHHGRFGAAHFAQLFAGQRQHFQLFGARAVRQVHRAGGRSGLRQQLDEGACGHGLAGTGLAHHADDLLTGNFEADLVDGFDGTGVGHERDAEVLDLGEIAFLDFTHRFTPLPRKPIRKPRMTDHGR